MRNHIRCKRIIDGKTYNTETATLLGRRDPDSGPYDEALFKNRHGAYFLHTEHCGDLTEGIRPCGFEEARQWMEQHCSTERTEAEFGEMPEAGDPEARFTLRLPESLRRQAANSAEKRGQSLNAWMLRCIERGVQSEEASSAS